MKGMMNIFTIVLIVCLGRSSVLGYEDVTLVEYINKHNFVFFKNLIQQAGLTDVLSQTGPYTAFVPTDAAFAAFGPDKLNELSTTQLKSLIKYHIVDGYILSPMVSSRDNFTTLLGEPVSLEPSGGANPAVVVNSIAHVDGTDNDNIVNNGVIQPIDAVLMPPDKYLTAETIAQILILDDGHFKDLLLTFMLAEMINLLEHNEFTLFAPTDDAFLPYRDRILDPNDGVGPSDYQEVLKNHIVPGARKISDLTDGLKLYTLHGTSLVFSRVGTKLLVNNVTVSQTDIFASNGYIHAVDDFLIPPDIGPPARK